jgi:NAD-dependent deacetylase
VLFGEMLPSDKLNDLIHELERGFDMVFTIGTTSVFPYIMQPVLYAKQQGVLTVEINPGETRVSHFVDYKVTSGAADSLSMLYDIFTMSTNT